MKLLQNNLRYLCDESRMLTGIIIAYGTAEKSESLLYGRAQEITTNECGCLIPCVRPLKPDALFDLASLTKLFTCVTAMKLVEQGRLSLDETIGDIDSRFLFLRDVSVFDVLSFRASLQTPGRIDEAPDREEGLKRLFRTIRTELPRIRLYSDINAMVMKYVIEQKTNLPFAEALNRHILHPLGLSDTYAHVPLCERERCVCYSYEHRIFKDTYKLRTTPALGQAHDPKALLLSQDGLDLCGHAGLFSTRADMVRFAQGLLQGALLRPETLSSIGTNYTGMDYGDGTHRQYLGFLCFTKHPNQTLSEVPEWMKPGAFGLSGFTGNHLSIDPDAKSFVLILGNRCHGRVSNIQPPSGKTLPDYGLAKNGTGYVKWNDGRLVSSSARYVYFKDKLLNNPIHERMQTLGWL